MYKMASFNWCALLLLFLLVAELLLVSAAGEGGGKKKKKKSVMDLSEADVERIYQQWEENDEDEDHESSRPPHLRRDPDTDMGIDLEGLRSGKVDPEQILRQSKKGKPVMMFVGVRGTADRAYTEKISGRWMQSLQNAHLQAQRHVVADDRVLFLIEDGSKAWEVKDYLVSQTECTTVSFEQLSFNCAEPAKKTEL